MRHHPEPHPTPGGVRHHKVLKLSRVGPQRHMGRVRARPRSQRLQQDTVVVPGLVARGCTQGVRVIGPERTLGASSLTLATVCDTCEIWI